LLKEANVNSKLIYVLLVLSLLATGVVACSTPQVAAAPDGPSTDITAPDAQNTQPNHEVASGGEGTPSSGATGSEPAGGVYSYTVVDTGQTQCYDSAGAASACPAEGEALYGQDAQYAGAQPSYVDNPSTSSRQGRTVTDLNTGLTWQASPDTNGDGTIDVADKMTYQEAVARAETLTLGGYDDWRLPTIKELYSLIDFGGRDVSGPNATDLTPFIDTDYFEFGYGDTGAGERLIDAQFASSTLYVSSVMNGAQAMFGVNFADGRIKGYPIEALRGQAEGKTFYVLYVRGNPDYGTNAFIDNGDGTVTDMATGLTWQQGDSGAGMAWDDALAYCEGLEAGGYDDWRLPNAKELQSIVDYGRSPDTTGSAAIDPLFDATPITNEAGQTDYGSYWSSTTHANQFGGQNAVYVAFGRALGNMNGQWIDVHGAGAQRSDPKTGEMVQGVSSRGAQGDAVRVDNLVRCVRGGESAPSSGEMPPSGGEAPESGGQQPPAGGQGGAPSGEMPPVGGEAPSSDGAGGPGQRPDLAAAAAQLGVTEVALREALGEPGQGPPPSGPAAQQLGVSEAQLREALGVP
jgi:hypothetical protein